MEKPEGATRIMFDFSEEAFKEISDLQMSCGLPDRATVLQLGIRLLQIHQEALLVGKKIYVGNLEGQNEDEEVTMVEIQLEALSLPHLKEI
jgi:hypothetical protein